MATVEERFWKKVEKTRTCWLWKGCIIKDRGGYGQFGVSNKNKQSAHRFAYELLKTKIPEGFQVDHICRTPSCVNPDHLEIVSSRQNVHRSLSPAGINKRKTHCYKGHEFTEQNIYRRPNGKRNCRICKNEVKRTWRECAARHGMGPP